MKIRELFEATGPFPGSEVSELVYHGTNAEFDKFENKGGTVSTILSLEHVERYGFFFAPNKEFASEFTKTGKIVSAYLNIRNMLDLVEAYSDQMDALEKAGVNPRVFYVRPATEYWELFDTIDGLSFVNKIKTAGFDGVKMIEADGNGRNQIVYVVFNENQIRVIPIVKEADTLQLPELEKGDTLLVGKFKNRKATIKGFKKDDLNQPVAITDKGDQKLLKPRVPKLY